MSKTIRSVASAAPPQTREDLVRSLVGGERRFHELPKDLSPEEAAEIRRQALEEITQTPLDNIAHHSLDVVRASCWKRAMTPKSTERPAGRSFSATGRPSARSSALYTTDVAPSPIRSSTR